ncbi:hypothetical protein Ahia01_000544900 [Argonauta hians]
MEKTLAVRTATKKVLRDLYALKALLKREDVLSLDKCITLVKDSSQELWLEIVIAGSKGVAENDTCILVAKDTEQKAEALAIEADLFLIRVRRDEEVREKKRVISMELANLCASMKLFRSSLTQEANTDRLTHRMEDYRRMKIDLMCKLDDNDGSALEELYRSTEQSFRVWERSMDRLEQHQVDKKMNTNAPMLKLDRLAVPTFPGDTRAFARFVREFDNTNIKTSCFSPEPRAANWEPQTGGSECSLKERSSQSLKEESASDSKTEDDEEDSEVDSDEKYKGDTCDDSDPEDEEEETVDVEEETVDVEAEDDYDNQYLTREIEKPCDDSDPEDEEEETVDVEAEDDYDNQYLMREIEKPCDDSDPEDEEEKTGC